MTKEPLKLHFVESTDALLDHMNKLNEQGEIKSLMTVFFDAQGNIQTHWAGVMTITRSIGALERLRMSILVAAGET